MFSQNRDRAISLVDPQFHQNPRSLFQIIFTNIHEQFVKYYRICPFNDINVHFIIIIPGKSVNAAQISYLCLFKLTVYLEGLLTHISTLNDNADTHSVRRTPTRIVS